MKEIILMHHLNDVKLCHFTVLIYTIFERDVLIKFIILALLQ